MQKSQLLKFKSALKKASKITIVTHFNPDGDALGSSLGLHHLLQYIGKDAKVIVPNPYPDFLEWLPGSKNILVFSENEKKTKAWIQSSDMIFALDFNAFGRLEKLGSILQDSPVTKVLIDHHQQPDDFADYSWHDVKATSTSELVFDFIKDTGNIKRLDKKIAACLYTGLMTDTGSFSYPG
jgi:phosphoesterase RecJ-like protein